jgi:hypothetical protein
MLPKILRSPLRLMVGGPAWLDYRFKHNAKVYHGKSSENDLNSGFSKFQE